MKFAIARFGADSAIAVAGSLVGGLDQRAPDVGIAQRGFLLRERKFADVAPYRQPIERQMSLERQHAG